MREGALDRQETSQSQASRGYWYFVSVLVFCGTCTRQPQRTRHGRHRSRHHGLEESRRAHEATSAQELGQGCSAGPRQAGVGVAGAAGLEDGQGDEPVPVRGRAWANSMGVEAAASARPAVTQRAHTTRPLATRRAPTAVAGQLDLPSSRTAPSNSSVVVVGVGVGGGQSPWLRAVAEAEAWVGRGCSPANNWPGLGVTSSIPSRAMHTRIDTQKE